MRAAVMQGVGKPLKVETLADPRPDAGGVVVKVGRCGICGSDLHMANDPAYGVGAGEILGHEFAGEVVELGGDVQGLRIGDLVSVSPLRGCGHCPSCRAGEISWCESFGLQGGGYAEYALTTAHQCIALPRGISLADGAIIEPLAVALHGVTMSGMKMGSTVLVLGAGPIGLAVAFWAKRLGAAKVVVQDVQSHQQERALGMGATGFVAQPDDPVGSAQRALGGGADYVFECVGLPGLIEQAVKQVNKRGTICLLGLCSQPDTFNSFAMLSKEARLVTSAFFTLTDFQVALDALESGAAEPRMLVTDTVSLDNTPAMFASLRHRTRHCKVLIAPFV